MPVKGSPAPREPRHRRRGRRTAMPWAVAGIALIVVAALVLAVPLLVELWAKPLQSAREQDRLDGAIEQQWDGVPARAGDRGSADDRLFARLHLPKLDRHWVVVRGVNEADIEHAPGVYPDSQPPGRPGNVAIFGHRRKKLFWDLDRLGRGDLAVVETKAQWLTYRVYNTKIVRPSDTSVVTWNPDSGRVDPSRKLLTLVTCAPKLSTTERLVVHAELTSIRSRQAGPPPGVPTG